MPRGRRRRADGARRRQAAGRGSSLVALLVLATAARPVSALEVGVDPVEGEDTLPRLRDERPVRTVHFALLFARPDDGELILRLAPGVYRGGELFEDFAEVFPWAVDPRPLRRIAVLGPEEGEARVEVLGDHLSVLRVVPVPGAPLEPRDGPLRVEVRRLLIAGGHTGVSVEGEASRDVELEAEALRFEDLAGPAVEFLPGAGAAARAEVRDGVVLGSGGGVAADAARDGSLRVEIASCRFEGLDAVGPGARLGAAVELHAATGSALEAAVDRSVFRDTPTALSLASSPGADDIALSVTQNLVVASPAGDGGPSVEAPGVRRGLLAALRAPRRAEVLCAGNTWIGVGGALVRCDRTVAGEELVLRFRSELVWGDGSRLAGPFLLADGGEPQGVGIARSRVPAGWLEALGPRDEGGLTADPPGFVDPARGDFRLRADSPLVDRGDPAVADRLGRVDLGGRCRRTAGPEAPAGSYALDPGAYEAPGPCAFGRFRRGDCDASGSVEVTDAVTLFNRLFLGAPPPVCPDACDADDSGALDVTDGIYTLGWLFLGGPAPPPPFSEPGPDPTVDPLGDC